MNIETKFLGEVEIQQSEILTFEQGLPGFPDYTKYILIGLDADLPLALLQSIDAAEMGFVVAYPYAFNNEYAFDISEEDKKQLQINHADDVITYAIVTLKEDFPESTMNLLAPVIVNTKTKLGKQIVLHDSEKYPLRCKLGTFEGSAL
ncbi:flagellar assembly protein FliW [Solibacillus sp. R5-41]|uniref:flagellar assembly protein FliW n=1 Tax=Solibacillus sp. R5-41 TaxID=2048654 RepID=UPI000C128E6E|nr:flagellar assembly protein FliW [Solibacillus sp. R5-41]ATP39070.1 flagellar assembly protein FliW [Solibacillus sp. R5-41]